MKNFILGIVFLTAGGFIYLSLRDTHLLMFHWFAVLGLHPFIAVLRDFVGSISVRWPNWFIYSLPYGLWILSGNFFLNGIWKGKRKEKILWMLIFFGIALGSELGQLFHLVRGTFDITDILFILLSFLVSYLIMQASSKAYHPIKS